MAQQSKKVFLIGPGFIGAELLEILIDEGYDVTTMVRREEAAPDFEKLGAKVILATLADKDIITQHVVEHPTVIHTATADDLPSVEAVIDGIRKRANSGKSTIYIHTSGASLITDNCVGRLKSDQVYDDEKPEEIDALPDSAPHRTIDLAIVKARKELGTKAKMAIMIPPVIYGLGCKGNRLSIQLPTLTRFAIKHGFAGYVGAGKSMWALIHVADLARAYALLLHWLEIEESDDIYKNPYFFCENGQELSWAEMAEIIGKELHRAGKLNSPEPRTIPEDLYVDVMGDWTAAVVGANARNKATRLRKLGWKPQAKSAEESLRDDEIPVIAKETGTFAGYGKAVAS
ncbi:hypothetical protein LTR06_011243 [Exophiala xenobiotica]|nr:hypothetical protein LTR06_011243 [Exophiala xenobiotica]